MTDEELRAIRDRCEKATPGPWIEDNGYRVRNMAGEVLFETKHFEASVGNDAAFCANARSDVPKLLAEVDRLRSTEKLLDGPNRSATMVGSWCRAEAARVAHNHEVVECNSHRQHFEAHLFL